MQHDGNVGVLAWGPVSLALHATYTHSAVVLVDVDPNDLQVTVRAPHKHAGDG